MIELLVAICVSVILLVIVAFVFKISAAATRDANSRVGMTERLRLVNIRLRQEIGAMLPIPRLDPSTKPLAPYPDKRTFDVAADGTWIMFATSTVQDGLPVNVDVKYEFLQSPDGDPHKNVLVRWRDHTGPYDNTTHLANPNYTLGDNSFEAPTSGSTYFNADVLMQNVRSVKFDVSSMDVPAGMPLTDGQAASSVPNPTDLYPRQLPAGVELDIEYGPEQGDLDKLERQDLFFTVYRGL
ncbi:MAG: hypothetical protein ABSE73_03470 [Planctomycetota bacterium]